jgi:hypothetical protein
MKHEEPDTELEAAEVDKPLEDGDEGEGESR